MNICFSTSIAQHGEIIIIINSSPWSQNLSLRVRVLKVHCSYCSWPSIASIDVWSCYIYKKYVDEFKSMLGNVGMWWGMTWQCWNLDMCKTAQYLCGLVWQHPMVTSGMPVMPILISFSSIGFIFDWITTRHMLRHADIPHWWSIRRGVTCTKSFSWGHSNTIWYGQHGNLAIDLCILAYLVIDLAINWVLLFTLSLHEATCIYIYM